MKTNVKKVSIISLSIIFIVSMFFGLFFNSLTNKNKLVEATPADTYYGNDNFYFERGAAVSADSMDPYRIRFYLYVNESVISNSDVVSLSFSSLLNVNDLYFVSSTSLSKSDFSEFDIDDYGNKILRAKITLHAPLYYEFSINATLNSYFITSDTRSIYYIWGKLVEYDDFLDYDPEFETLVRSKVEFADDTISNFSTATDGSLIGSASFKMDLQPTISRDGALRFDFSLSEEVKDELLSPYRCICDEDSTFGLVRYHTYTVARKALVLYRSLTNDFYDLTSVPYSYVLGLNEESIGDITVRYGDGSYATLYREYTGFSLKGPYLAFVLNCEDERYSLYSVEIPFYSNDVATEYYYYLAVVEIPCTIITELVGVDFGIFGEVYFRNSFRAYVASGQKNLIFSENYLHISVRTVAERLLSRDLTLTDDERAYLQDVGGVAPSDSTVDVHVKFKKMVDYATIVDDEYVFSVNSLWVQSKDLVVRSLMNNKDISYLSDFNVVYDEEKYFIDGAVNTTYSRVYLQADDFTYSYNSDTEYAELLVQYEPFNYSNFFIRLTNNDPNNNLAMDIYCTDVKEDVFGNIVMTFDFSKIEEQMHNNVGWLFDLRAEDFNCINNGAVNYAFTTDSENGSCLTISFSKGTENDLSKLFIRCVAPIVEDVQYYVYLDYLSLECSGKNITKNEELSGIGLMWYSDIVDLNLNNLIKKEVFKNLVYNTISLDVLDGYYYEPNELVKSGVQNEIFTSNDVEYPTYKLKIEYTTNALFCISNNLNSLISWKVLLGNTLTYYGSDFVTDIPTGYRVENIEIDSSYVRSKTNENYAESLYEVLIDVDSDTIIPVQINYTDSWNVVINYMEQYKSPYYQKNSGYTPFFTKKSVTKSVKVSEVDNIYNIPYEKLASIAGVEDFKLLKLANAEIPTATYDGIDTYTYDLIYPETTVSQIDYNGKKYEIKVPLTSYANWQKVIGKDWSIKYLNSPDSIYFGYTNDIAPENLFGFFTVFVYDTKISDFNAIFEQVTALGCVTVHDEEQVVGSSIYEWFGDLKFEGNIISSAIGTAGMIFCETINNDNTLYHSYFTFLDGTVASPFHSNSGAENEDDTDSASKNFFDDLSDSIADWFADFKSSPLVKILKVVGFVIIGVAAFGVISWIWRIFKPKK